MAPTIADARTAVEHIHQRRLDHPALDRFPDQEDLLGVVAYVATFPQVNPEKRRADALDRLRILGYVRTVEEELRLKAINTARECNATWRDIAGPLGVTSAQGAEQTALRLTNHLKAHGPRDEKAARAAAQQPPPVATPTRDVQPLRQLVARLLELRGGLSEDLAEEIGLLRSEATEARAEFGYRELRDALRLLVTDLLSHPVDDGLRAVLEEGAELLSD